tara:strand:- start:1141 stop:1386 length:246 start_codon:yes stop_codon:yes gene_type:complete
MLLLQACTYKPVIDTAGRSGTFNETKADQITNDIQHCKQVAKENTSVVRNISSWMLSPTMESRYQVLYKKCLINRGHSVLN